jgi:MerR family redox-sensitive transcriptional activator SoxR
LLIGELARRARLRPSAIRYYESIGLLPEPPRVTGQRRYAPEAQRRLSVIGTAQRAGLSLDEIRELLTVSDRDRTVSVRMRSIAERKLPEIEALIARAELVWSWLRAAAECQCPSLEECPLFHDSSDIENTSRRRSRNGQRSLTG